jgi:fructosamine-3-kinase
MKIQSSVSLSGGCINDAYMLATTVGKFFLKYNLSGNYPGMFEAEARGLSILRATSTLRIPEVIFQGSADEYDFLMLEFIEPGRRVVSFYEDMGQSLAQMHKVTQTHFGLDHNNYIGSLPQDNRPLPGFHDFFIARRLEPMIRMARDHGKMDSGHQKKFERFFQALPGLIPSESPALLHGDLWNGNYLVNEAGTATLIDPAVYYGHRETDLAMTKLFGGFDNSFYHTYQEAFPLEKGWESRMDFHNLYPLMVHVNLFGGGYLRSVLDILRAF